MKIFVWDFHGVLEKGTENAVFEISNLILKEFGYSQRLTRKDCDHLYGLKWHEYFRYLLPDQPPEIHLQLQEACFSKQQLHPHLVAQHLQPNDHAHLVLNKISQKHQQIVISNTQPPALDFFIKAIGLDNYFGPRNSFAIDAHRPTNHRTKHQVLSQYLSRKNFEKLVIIGDSPKDISLSSIAGGTTYLYAHPGRPFKTCPSDYQIRDLRQILKEI
jgi:phosphoglycolate phosphatase-like HAD superfamily hydrolase